MQTIHRQTSSSFTPILKKVVPTHYFSLDFPITELQTSQKGYLFPCTPDSNLYRLIDEDLTKLQTILTKCCADFQTKNEISDTLCDFYEVIKNLTQNCSRYQREKYPRTKNGKNRKKLVARLYSVLTNPNFVDCIFVKDYYRKYLVSTLSSADPSSTFLDALIQLKEEFIKRTHDLDINYMETIPEVSPSFEHTPIS